MHCLPHKVELGVGKGMGGWYIATLVGAQGGGPGGAHAGARVEVLGAATATIAGQVGVGGIGAVAADDDICGGYYLVKWTGAPGASAGGNVACVGHWFEEAPRARLWPQVVHNPGGVVVGMRYVVGAAVGVKVYPETNMLPPQAQHTLVGGNWPVKLTGNSHHYSLGEARRRPHLGHDPEGALVMGVNTVG